MARRYTVVLLPRGPGKIRRFKLPPFITTFFVLLFLALAGSTGYLAYRLHEVQIRHARLQPQLIALKRDNLHQRIQIQSFATQIKIFRAQMNRLSRFNKRLMVMANLDKKGKRRQIMSVGGPSSGLSGVRIDLAGGQAGMVRGMHRQLASLRTEAKIQQLSQRSLIRYLKKQRSLLASTPSIWPAVGWVTSGFGYRRSPYTGRSSFHSGIDIANKNGTPVYATADGVVVKVAFETGYGRSITINHGYGIKTKYAHLRSKVFVKEGQRVRRGQRIAGVGMTGRTTGPHLHYEVRVGGAPVNPRRYLID